MQQGAKLRRRGRGEEAPGASRGAAGKRRRAGPAHPGGRGPRLRSRANFAKRAGGAPGPVRPGPRETEWDPRSSGQTGTTGCLRGKGGHTHHGSNSWMMLSKRMTAKRRELKPASQAKKRMVKESNDCHPAGCDKPPDSPAGGPGFGAAAALDALWAPGPWCPWRLFPRAMRPLHGDELRDDLCLLSGAEGSAMLCPGGGSRSSSAATAAAWSEGCWAETQRRRRGGEEEGDGDDDEEEEAEEELGALPPSAPRGRDTGGGGGGGSDPESPPQQRPRPPRSQPKRPLRPTSHPCPPCG